MPKAKYFKIKEFITDPFDPTVAKIVGGFGGGIVGIGIIGSAVAQGSLSIPTIIGVFIAFTAAFAALGAYLIGLTAKHSASISTIVCAIAGADFAGSLGAILATISAGLANVIVHEVAGMTIDDMFADSIVGSLNGFEEIMKDSREAVSKMKTKENGLGQLNYRAKEMQVEVQHSTPQGHVMQTHNVHMHKKIVHNQEKKRSKKTFAEKLEEARSIDGTKTLTEKLEDIRKTESKKSFAEKFEELKETGRDKKVRR